MSAGQGSRPLPWHRASFLADLFPQSQPHRAALEVRQKTVPLFDLLQRLRRLQTGHLRLPCSNQHRPQGHSRFPPHPPFPDILKITDREEVKYNLKLTVLGQAMIGHYLRAEAWPDFVDFRTIPGCPLTIAAGADFEPANP